MKKLLAFCLSLLLLMTACHTTDTSTTVPDTQPISTPASTTVEMTIETTTQAPIVEEMVWISTKGGIKYHIRASCSNMNGPRQVTIFEAQELGFTPCKKCY